MTVAKTSKIPLLLLTGFLGSGKTTLLRNWLKSPEFRDAMVIVNELGEIGLDHHLLAGASETTVLLENGCACCTAAEGLTETLERLFWDRLHRKAPRFSWMLIETTGIADPRSILGNLRDSALVAERFEAVGVVTTFDAVEGMRLLPQFMEIRAQLAAASVIVITRADTATASEIEAAHSTLAEVNRAAPLLLSAQGDLPAAAVLTALQATSSGARLIRPAEIGMSGEIEAHRHTPGVSSDFLHLPGPVILDDLLQALRALHADWDRPLLRAKGLVRTANGLRTLQLSPGGAIETGRPAPGGSADVESFGLTIITQGRPASRATEELAALLARPASEEAERQAPVRELVT